MNVYIAGPMRGYPGHNFPLFNHVAAVLRADGYDVVNPAESDALWETSPRLTAAVDLAIVASWADRVIVLPGWEKSVGATAEVAAALFAGIDVFERTLVDTWPEPVYAPVSGLVVSRG